MNNSFEPKFGNPSFETLEKLNVFNFWLACFSAFVDFILWKQASAEKPGGLNLFLSYFFTIHQKKVFKTWVLTQPDFETRKKSKSEKSHFWFGKIAVFSS